MMRRFVLTVGVFVLACLATPAIYAQVGGGAPSSETDRAQEGEEADEVEDSGDDVEQEAADESDETAAASESDSSGMATSKASQERTLPGGTLAVISYIILWLMTLAFVGFTARRQSELADELETLEGRMDDVLGGFEDEV